MSARRRKVGATGAVLAHAMVCGPLRDIMCVAMSVRSMP